MKKLIKLISKNKDKNLFWEILFTTSLEFYNFLHKVTPTKVLIKYKYKKIFGKQPDLKNPKTLNEKLQWKKIYDKNPLHIICADKYAVRSYIKNKIGRKYLIPLLDSTSDPCKINFNKIPTPFIIKTNHGSGQIIVIKSEKDINKKQIIKKCKKWLKSNLYYLTREPQYKNIKPRILIEKLLLTSKGKVPEDYKIYCFDGKVEFILVVKDRFQNKTLSYFNTKWKLLPFSWCELKNNKPRYRASKSIPKPKNLNKMIKIAEKLSKEFDYVRVDLYSINNKIYFGELTFTPGAGFDKFFPDKWDRFYGDKLELPIKNEPFASKQQNKPN